MERSNLLELSDDKEESGSKRTEESCPLLPLEAERLAPTLLVRRKWFIREMSTSPKLSY